MRKKILVVDDEPLIGRGITRLLNRDHDVEWVSSVSEAIVSLERDSGYALVMSDLLMPERTGIDLFQEVGRRWPDLAERMVFLTGGAANDKSREFLDSIGHKCLMKPFNGDELRDAVASAISAKMAV